MQAEASDMRRGFEGMGTLLMCVYARDDAGLFRRAISSVYENSLLPDDFLLVVDGPVPECIEAVIQSSLEQYPDFRVLRLPHNEGLANALNAGLSQIDSKWVIRADADDINLPHRFETLARVIEEMPHLDIVGSAILEVDQSGRGIAKRVVPVEQDAIRAFAARRNPFNHMSVAYRRLAVVNAGGYPNLDKREDYALWVRMLSAGASVRNVPNVLVHATTGSAFYRRRGGWSYALGEIALQRLFVRCGFKGIFRATLDGSIRLAVFLLPNRLRVYVYENLLRYSALSDLTRQRRSSDDES